MDMLDKILANIATWKEPLFEIVPVNYGEFFCNDRWLEILRKIEITLPQTGITIPTNGSYLDEDAIQKLCSIRTLKLINFSVNALYLDTYKQFMSLDESTLVKIKESISLIRRLRPGVIIRISMVYDPAYQSETEKEMFYLYYKQFAQVWIIAAANCNRYPIKIHTTLPCRSLFSDLVIGYDGKITSCCFDAGFRLDLGYLNGSVLDAWNNPELTQLRATHNEGRRQEIDWCKNCSFA